MISDVRKVLPDGLPSLQSRRHPQAENGQGHEAFAYSTAHSLHLFCRHERPPESDRREGTKECPPPPTYKHRSGTER